jgi:c-di-GMP-binding flagellar brake protein YcgR
MQSYTGPERRQYVRIEVATVMHLVVFEAQGRALIDVKELIKLRKGLTCNLSVAGICIQTNELKDEWISDMLSGKIQVLLKFQLPNTSEPISSTAKVIWIEKNENSEQYKYTLGLKFITIDEPSRRRIAEYINFRSKTCEEV